MSKRRLFNTKFKTKDILLFLLSLIVIFEIILIFYLWPKRIKPVKPPEFLPVENKIAIVIDDWGYNKRNLDFIRESEIPITVSILPNLRYSKEIANFAKSNNKEVIIHLPLEPHPVREVGLEKNVILTNMSEEKINEIFNNAFGSVPYCKGVSNHMGSKATEDRKVMNTLFKIFKQNNLYFLDSLVTSDSICEDLAKDMNLKFTKRDVFLDNKLDADYIRNQLNLLVDKAKNNGYAIGIGHDRSLTLKVIKESVADIEKENIKFVFVSELLR